jgi:CRP-like cAMP-binding protein
LILNRHPKLAAAILWMISRDEAIVCEHLVNVGRRDATQRVAHMLLELAQRIGERQGREMACVFECPLTQVDLADAVGLTAIHVNRVLRILRERRLVNMTRNQVTIHDPEGLSELAGFDATYLQLTNSIAS